jgi:hypothetical protein
MSASISNIGDSKARVNARRKSRRLGLERLEGREVPAFYLVTTTDDTSGLSPSAGSGSSSDPFQIDSLRSAIEGANASTGTPDTISFSETLTGQTITLDFENEPLTFTGMAITTVEGGNRQITISGNVERSHRVIEVLPLATATINNLTITEGTDAVPFVGDGGDADAAPPPTTFGGGGIRNAGSLNLNSVIVTDNRSVNPEGGGAGIFNDFGAALFVSRSTISNNWATSFSDEVFVHGGGILNRGTMTLVATTVKDNVARGVGGGIYNIGAANLDRSTVSGNRSEDPEIGGGGSGGGIQNNGDLWLRNTTVSGNFSPTSGGGIFHSANGLINLLNCTVTQNNANSEAGGIKFAGTGAASTIVLRNTIVAGNTLGGESPNDIVGAVVSRGPRAVVRASAVSARYCLFGVASEITLSGPGNLTGVTDPRLGDLQDNGGDTFTHALLPDSPAFNRGDPSRAGLPPTDQRGGTFRRVGGGRVDIGAFEVQLPNPVVRRLKRILLLLQRRYH